MMNEHQYDHIARGHQSRHAGIGFAVTLDPKDSSGAEIAVPFSQTDRPGAQVVAVVDRPLAQPAVRVD